MRGKKWDAPAFKVKREKGRSNARRRWNFFRGCWECFLGGRGQIWLSRGLAILVVRGVWTPPWTPPTQTYGLSILSADRMDEMESVTWKCRKKEEGGNKTHRVVTWKVVNFSDIDAPSSHVARSHYKAKAEMPVHIYLRSKQTKWNWKLLVHEKKPALWMHFHLVLERLAWKLWSYLWSPMTVLQKFF